jgi:hypothetical protein
MGPVADTSQSRSLRPTERSFRVEQAEIATPEVPGRCFNLEVRPSIQGLAEGSPANEDCAPDFSVDYMIKDLSCVLRTPEALRVQPI